MSEDLFGQEEPLDSIQRFIDDLPLGPSALVLEGEVGTGKSALWTATVAAARGRGHRVLACRPVESERTMTFAALGDLLRGLLQEWHPDLPEPQYRALRVATLIDDPGAAPPDQRSVSVATLGVLRSLSRHSALLVAIDDLKWMDGASVRVLEYALRRLDTEPVGVVAAVRPGDPSLMPTIFDDMSAERRPTRVAPVPLGPDALDGLFRARLGESFARSALPWIAAASGGNPLFALEIARAMLRGEIRRDAGKRLSVPETLQQFVGTRLADLPKEVRELLFFAAAVSEPTIDLLRRAARRPERLAATLDVAERAGVIERAGDGVRFAHPLFASTLYHQMPAQTRRELHAILAGAVAVPDERALHLALAAEGPDGTVAEALDAAAQRALSRGAPDAAADLSEQARRLTPEADHRARDRRCVESAEYRFAAGDTGGARQLLEGMAAALQPGPERADILRRLAKVRYRNDSCAIAADLLARALEEAGNATELGAGIQRDLAWAEILCGDVRIAAEHAQAALRLVQGRYDDAMVAELLAATAMVGFLLGEGMRPELMRRALELERPRSEVPIEWRPTMILGMMLKWSGDFGGARGHFDALHRATLDRGEEASLPFLLAQMSEVETWAGEWDSARNHAQVAHTLALQTGQEPIRACALYARGLVEAHLGLIEQARATALTGLEISEKAGSVVWMMQNQAVLGFVELSIDDALAAHAWLAPLVVWQEVVGIREPEVLRFIPDEIEALISLGELDQADGLLTSYEADARRHEGSWAMLAAARCRALHIAAAGDSQAASGSLEKALERYGPRSQPFDHARALLALGTILRRTRRRKAARTSLEAALRIFNDLGATAWSSKSLRALGGVFGTSLQSMAATLTPAEQRVADSIAAGATNREAADRLFVSVRAIETHLTSIYRKLGVSSRSQLAVKMAVATAAPHGPDATIRGDATPEVARASR
ncbi:MAG: AAA family ATPase [Chloroflexi bacterium]|jgi:DNA-binding CsgD family transcriptional regulator|nr:AAA family ATPase [Chloroflexota bacterium]